MHVATGYVFAEIVQMDNHDWKLPEGTGEIVVTVLWRRSSPLIRYQTGLIGCIDRSPCPCGIESPRIHFLGDRTEFLELGRSKVSLLEVEDSLTELIEISPWCYLRPQGDVLNVLIPSGMSPQKKKELAEKAETKLRERLDLPLRVEVEEHSLTYGGEHWNRVLTS
jgi:phenylacetate-CoA ligase